MGWNRVVHCLMCFALLFAVVAGLVGTQVTVKAQEEPLIEEKLEAICTYPALPGKSGDTFEFDVELRWHSTEFRQFDVNAAGPPDWTVKILGGYENKELAGRIGLEPMAPGETYPTESLTVRFAPLEGTSPEPGDYVVTLEISSGNIRETIEFKAVVTALYRFAFYTATGLLNTEVTAGEDNHFSLIVVNTGTATLERIDLSTYTKPRDWSITFNPERVELLEPGIAREIDVVITPPSKTIAGDWAATLSAWSSDLPASRVELRITVLTPTIWGWVGILIVLAIIAGLAVMFWRLGRR